VLPGSNPMHSLVGLHIQKSEVGMRKLEEEKGFI